MELTDVDVLQLVRDWIRERRLLWSDIGATAVKLTFREGLAGVACYSLYIEVTPGLLKCTATSAFRVPPGPARLRVALLVAGINARTAGEGGATAELDAEDGEVRMRQAFPIHGATPGMVRALLQLLTDRALAYPALAEAAAAAAREGGEVDGWLQRAVTMGTSCMAPVPPQVRQRHS